MATFTKNDNLKDLFTFISSKKKFDYLTENQIEPLAQKLDSKGRTIYVYDNNDEFKDVMSRYLK